MVLVTQFSFAHATERIEILTHYSYPPYIVSKSEGLSFELASYLTQASKGRFKFVVVLVPKNRLMHNLKNTHWKGIVPWVTPIWMQELQGRRFIWSETLFEAGDVVVSRKARAIEWRSPADIYGLRFGGILGHSYSDLDMAFLENKILREDAPDLVSNLKKLEAGRVDVLFAPDYAIKYFAMQAPQLLSELHVSKHMRNPNKFKIKLMFNLGSPSANKWL